MIKYLTQLCIRSKQKPQILIYMYNGIPYKSTTAANAVTNFKNDKFSCGIKSHVRFQVENCCS